MTSTINAKDFKGSLVGAMIKINPSRGADFEQLYSQSSDFAQFRVVSDNQEVTQNGSGIRMIEFQNVAQVWEALEGGEYTRTGVLKYPEVLSSKADRFDVSQKFSAFAPLDNAS